MHTLLTHSCSYISHLRIHYHPHPPFSGNLFLPGPSPAHAHLRRSPDDSLVFLSPSCLLDLSADITLSPWVMIGPSCILWTHQHTFDASTPPLLYEEKFPSTAISTHPKSIGAGVWLSSAITLLPQCTAIADGVVIGAGAIVTKPITEPFSIWAGNPARFIKFRKDNQ